LLAGARIRKSWTKQALSVSPSSLDGPSATPFRQYTRPGHTDFTDIRVHLHPDMEAHRMRGVQRSGGMHVPALCYSLVRLVTSLMSSRGLMWLMQPAAASRTNCSGFLRHYASNRIVDTAPLNSVVGHRIPPRLTAERQLTRVNSINVLDERLKIGGRGHRMNSKVKTQTNKVKLGVCLRIS
jgi:hypothetical protein